VRIRHEAGPTLQQVTVDMFALRDWSNELPKGTSIRDDLPPTGLQLWANYFLYKHPISGPYPILHTTYARMPFGVTGTYALTPRFVPGHGFERWPRPQHTDPVPVKQNFSFILWRLHMPKKYPDTSSVAMIQP